MNNHPLDPAALDAYFATQEALYAHCAYPDTSRRLPLLDCRGMFWALAQTKGELYWSKLPEAVRQRTVGLVTDSVIAASLFSGPDVTPAVAEGPVYCLVAVTLPEDKQGGFSVLETELKLQADGQYPLGILLDTFPTVKFGEHTYVVDGHRRRIIDRDRPQVRATWDKLVGDDLDRVEEAWTSWEAKQAKP